MRSARRTTHGLQRRLSWCLALAIALSMTVAWSGGSYASTARKERVSGGPTGSYVVPQGIHKIKHVIIIEQENRSFDSYFGTRCV